MPLVAAAELVGVLFALWGRDHRLGDDTEVAEALGRHAAVAIGTHRLVAERGRMAGVVLAARTANHEVNNALAEAIGYAQLLARDPALPASLRELAEAALAGATRAAHAVNRLAEIAETSEIVEIDWGPDVDATIDLRPPPG